MKLKKINKTEAKWAKELTSEQFRILRKKSTELPFTGKYYHNKKTGKYLCAGCENELFSSESKFDSGSGWPSFWEPASKERIEEKQDGGHFMKRVEVACSRCGGHLGHVFSDGPKPTGLRYCINSSALKFIEKKEKK
jgi:peptide-methionine (R)-S-oxide reductase